MNTQRTTARIVSLVTVSSLIGLFPQLAFGGAWTRPAGDWMILIPTSYVVADEAFDDNGDRVDRERFEMVEISPYIEYGITDALTGGIQPKYRRVSVDTSTGDETNSGLAETDAFLRYRLWQQDQAAFSVQGLVKAPINPDETDAAALGRDQVDVELSLLYGNRHTLDSGARVFYNGDVGYRKRFQDPDDEIHADAYVGWSWGGPLSLVLRSANTFGVGNEEGTREVLTTGPSFTRHEAQIIGSYQFSDSVTGVLGVSNTYAGENVGVGNTGSLSLMFTY